MFVLQNKFSHWSVYMLEEKIIDIKEFRLNDIVSDASILMIAGRGCKKHFVIGDIIKHYQNTKIRGIVISPESNNTYFYNNIKQNEYIYDEYKSDIIKKVLERQILILDKSKERAKIGKNTNTKAFIVMDNCLVNKKDRSYQMISELLFNGRHYHVSYLLTMQYPLGIKPELRCNFDYIFLFKDESLSNQKRMYEYYAGIFPNFESFRQVFLQLTSDGCMVIINRGSNNIFDTVMHYKII